MTRSPDERWGTDDLRNRELYTRLVSAHGYDYRALNWGSRASQARRFEVLSEIAPLAGASVLDVGCGLGDLYAFLRDRSLEVDYTGVDLTPAMVEAAQARFPEARFHVGSVVDLWAELETQFDYVFASGIFYLREVEPFEYMKSGIAGMFARCRRGVALNTLTGWASSQDAGEFYADPLETLAFCRTLTPWLVFRQDYHPSDFTLYLYKEPPQ